MLIFPVRLAFDAVASLGVALLFVVGLGALLTHEWDRATAMFAAAILVRSFVSGKP